MKQFIKRAIAGAGYLEGYGHHPGNFMMGIMVICGALAGAKRGSLAGAIGGAVFMLVAMLPFYITGCVSRAKEYERDMERTFNILRGE